MRCAECETRECEQGKDCTAGLAPETARKAYHGEALELLRVAASVEADHYMQATRLEEIAVLAKRFGVNRIGIAFCIGLADEARVVSSYLDKYFEVHSVCCKVGGLSKEEFGLKPLHGIGRETTCNPAGQAAVLNDAGTELNLVLGLCVGHDAQFHRNSEAPVVTLAAKDRMLAHNPLGAIYSRYHRETKLGIGVEDDDRGSSLEIENRRKGA
jgi:uncharacterized metal-binding protein